MVTKVKAIPRHESDITAAKAVISAAAGLATSTLAIAAGDATKALATAATVATTTLMERAEKAATAVTEAAAKALAEFPNLREDIREVRAAQQAESGITVNMVRDILQAHSAADEVRLKSIDDTVKAIDVNMSEQNNRLGTAETHITRQNLVIFGVAGPVALIILGFIGKQLMTTVIEAERQGTLMNLPNIVMGATIIFALLVGLASYFAYKVYKILSQHATSNVPPKE
jgi:uncharacterized membrane protein YdbT with pleckstrin-like domain